MTTKPGIHIEGAYIGGCGVGIRNEGGYINAEGATISNNGVGVESSNGSTTILNGAKIIDNGVGVVQFAMAEQAQEKSSSKKQGLLLGVAKVSGTFTGAAMNELLPK